MLASSLKGPGIVHPVQAGRGRQHKLLHPKLTAQFYQNLRPCQVRLEVNPWVLDRLADTGPRYEIDDCIERCSSPEFPQFPQFLAVRDVQPMKLEPRLALKLRQPPLLQPHVVGIVKIVHLELKRLYPDIS